MAFRYRIRRAVWRGVSRRGGDGVFDVIRLVDDWVVDRIDGLIDLFGEAVAGDGLGVDIFNIWSRIDPDTIRPAGARGTP